MLEFFTALLGHPILFTIVLLVIMGFVVMTYEFILRLFGKSMVDTNGQNVSEDEPPEFLKVKKPIDPNDGELQMAKGFVEDDDVKEWNEEEYVMDPDWIKNKGYIYENETKEG